MQQKMESIFRRVKGRTLILMSAAVIGTLALSVGTALAAPVGTSPVWVLSIFCCISIAHLSVTNRR